MESRGPGGSRWRMDGTPITPQVFEAWKDGEFRRSENGMEIEKARGGGLSPYHAALWGQMLAGGKAGGGVGRKHLSVFTVIRVAETAMLFGVVPRNYDISSGTDPFEHPGSCFYSAGNGKKFPVRTRTQATSDFQGRF